MSAEKRCENGIVKVSVKKLRELGLTVKIDPDLQFGIPGHVVISELSADNYSASKLHFQSVLFDLSVEASMEENIVREPASR